jgi:hypothetical protein
VGAGQATVEIQGAKFDNNTTIQLLGPGSSVVHDTAVFLQDGSTAFATFNLTGRPTGAYSVRATQSGGATTMLAAGLTVVAASGAVQPQIYLTLREGVLVGRQGQVTVNYSNPGNTDIEAPLLVISAAAALPDGSSLSVGAGAADLFGASQAAPNVLITPPNVLITLRRDGLSVSAPIAAAATEPSTPSVAASGLASVALPSPADPAASPVLEGQVENLSYGPAATVRDAVFASHRPVLGPSLPADDTRQSAGAWAWLAALPSSGNSANQDKTADSTVAALDELLARFGL